MRPTTLMCSILLLAAPAFTFPVPASLSSVLSPRGFCKGWCYNKAGDGNPGLAAGLVADDATYEQLQPLGEPNPPVGAP
ncbi:hypothetical protein ACLMJK_001189 [Lecanora helva]